MTSKKTIAARDTGRDIGTELLHAIRDVKAGKYGARYDVENRTGRTGDGPQFYGGELIIVVCPGFSPDRLGL